MEETETMEVEVDMEETETTEVEVDVEETDTKPEETECGAGMDGAGMDGTCIPLVFVFVFASVYKNTDYIVWNPRSFLLQTPGQAE